MIEIRETEFFQRAVKKLLSRDDIDMIAGILSLAPETGDVMKGSGGLRKMRYALPGRGKSGGARVIYYYIAADEVVYLISGYAKSKKENITPADLKIFTMLVRMIQEEGHA